MTNDIFQHLGQPTFLLCPTQYCATRAMPNVATSEYLNTLGSKLAQEIDIMWTGPKVISRLLSFESIEEITEVLRRPPVIWDNLHANDYDQKRVFLGPYSGRSPDLIPKLRGVLTNPNCEYGANFVAIHTLAQWSRCNVDGQRDLTLSTYFCLKKTEFLMTLKNILFNNLFHFHSQPKVFYNQNFRFWWYNEILKKKSGILKMSRTFILHNNNSEKLSTNREKLGSRSLFYLK